MWQALALAIAAIAHDAPPAPVAAGVSINGAAVTAGEVVWTDSGRTRWWVLASSAIAWRLEPRGRSQRQVTGQDLVEVCALNSSEACRFDGAQLEITLPPRRLRPLRVAPGGERTRTPAPQRTRGAYANYDIALVHDRGLRMQGLMEGRAFAGTSSAELRLAFVAEAGHAQLPAFSWRLMHDQPDAARAWVLGRIDAAAVDGGAPVGMVGMHVGRNFGLQPDATFVDRPQLLLATDRPIHADIQVDGRPVAGASVGYGTYLVEAGGELPGRGELQVVTTGDDGVRRVSRVSYYYAPQLLAPGATDWSVDIGRRTRDPLRANQLGDSAAAVGWAGGLGNGTTLRTQGFVDRDSRAGSVQLDFRVGVLGVVSSGVAAGRMDGASVNRAWFAHEYTDRRLNTSVFVERPLSDCVAFPDATPGPVVVAGAGACRRTRLGAGLVVSPHWALQASMQQIDDRAGGRLRFASVGARIASRALSATVGVQSVRAGRSADTIVSLTCFVPLDRHGLFSSITRDASGVQATSSLAGPLPGAETGRYRFDANAGREDGAGVEVVRDFESASMRVEALATRSHRRIGTTMSGSVGIFGGEVFAARRIADGFVLVDVGLPGIPVTLDHRPVGVTGPTGRILLPHARPYEANVVGIDARTIPLDRMLARDEMIAVPARGGGAIARFHVDAPGRTVQLRQADGSHVPAGAEVLLAGGRPATVGSAGRLYLPGGLDASPVRVQWGKESCLARASDDDSQWRCLPEGSR